jgi:hypothetical protein
MVIGAKTNARFRHAIPKLNEPVGPRISLSVRSIKTEINEENQEITGQGSDYQKKNFPFIMSYEDFKNKNDTVVFNEQVEKEMKEISEKANENLMKMKSQYV